MSISYYSEAKTNKGIITKAQQSASKELAGQSCSGKYFDFGNGLEYFVGGVWYENHSGQDIQMYSSYRAWWGITDAIVCPVNHKIILFDIGEDSANYLICPNNI
jgi:hypothetical protein